MFKACVGFVDYSMVCVGKVGRDIFESGFIDFSSQSLHNTPLNTHRQFPVSSPLFFSFFYTLSTTPTTATTLNIYRRKRGL